jgi:hypothetical protein
MMGALHSLLQARIHISCLAAGIHGAIAALLELCHHVAQSVLVALLLLTGTASLLQLPGLQVHRVYTLAQVSRHRTGPHGLLCVIGALLDTVDPLLQFAHLHDVLLEVQTASLSTCPNDVAPSEARCNVGKPPGADRAAADTTPVRLEDHSSEAAHGEREALHTLLDLFGTQEGISEDKSC